MIYYFEKFPVIILASRYDKKVAICGSVGSGHVFEIMASALTADGGKPEVDGDLAGVVALG